MSLLWNESGAEKHGQSMRRHLMLLPSLACQARCAYCFGPNRGPAMPEEVLEAALDWIGATQAPGQTLEITFHGGEPLLVGAAWYRHALPELARRFGPRLCLGLQSNLWLLDDELAALFAEYGVSLGTSLDGPEPITDAQRGPGYFGRTMAGVATARRHGLNPGIICTFTRRSAPHYRKVAGFFEQEGLSFSIHEVVGRAGEGPGGDLALAPEEHVSLCADLLDHYLANMDRLQISTFDRMACGLASGRGSLCTFGDCLGRYLTVAPGGGIYSCNRFVGHPDRQLGRVQDHPSLDDLARTSAWQRLRRRELTIHEECGDCPHFSYCRGGCPYNAAAAGDQGRDPRCPAYRRLFDRLSEQALAEVFSDDNLESVLERGPGELGLLHKGWLLQVMQGGTHPRQAARGAREAAAAAALGACACPEEALDRLDRAGVITMPEAALGSLRSLRTRLDDPTRGQRLNAYLHVTNACNLACGHCYAASGSGPAPSMAIEDAIVLVRGAAQAGFHKVVITVGEPLAHPQREALLEVLAGLRGGLGGLQIILRTNLAGPLSPALLNRLARSADQVVVSVDGDAASHDARRGTGTFARTVANLQELVAIAACFGPGSPAQLSISAVLSAAHADGTEGRSVRALGRALGLPVRLKPVLPLGRAAGWGLAPEHGSSADDAAVAAFRARATCGLGTNLYIGPAGDCFPCYALIGERHAVGNALDASLDEVLARNDAYRRVTVDSNRGCRACALRYLCGGFCRAWQPGEDPNTPLLDCTALWERASGLLRAALETLGVTEERWLAAGLPL